MWWWVWTAAMAGPEERIARLVDREDWARAHAVCTDNGVHELRDRDLRSLCAEAEYRATPPRDTVADLLAFRAKWRGTMEARRAFSRAAVIALPGEGASEAELRRHHRQYKGTDASELSLDRAEKVAFLAAREAGTLAAMVRFLERYPAGKLQRSARAEALANGLMEATTTGDPARWQQLLELLPEQSDKIREAGDGWRMRRVQSSLAGPCWDTPCATLPGGSSVVIDVPELPWDATVAASWRLQRSDGSLLSEGEVADALGLGREQVPGLTRFESTSSGVAWSAPTDWAQPPEAAEASWVLAIVLDGDDPILRPFRGTARWSAASGGGYAVAHYGESGLWIHGPELSVQWSEHTVRAGLSRDVLVATTSHLFHLHEGALYATPLATGVPAAVPLDDEAVSLHAAGERVWVRSGAETYLCTAESCVLVGKDWPKDQHPTEAWVLMQETDEKGATWSVVDEYGRTPFEYRFDGGCGDKYCYNTYTAAFDSSGRFLLTAGTRKSVHVLEVSELATGRVLARRSWDLSVRHERAEMGEMMHRAAPTPRAGEWVFWSSDNTAPHAPVLGLRLEEDQLHSTLLEGYDTAWYALGSDVFRHSDRLARGRSVSGARSGSRYGVTVTRGGERRREYSYPDKSRATCGGRRFRPGEVNAMWLPNADWLVVEPHHGACDTDEHIEYVGYMDGTPALIRLSDGRVFLDPMKVRLLRAGPSTGHAVLESLSPDRSGFVFDTHAVLPSGRLAELPSSGGHAWIPTPLSMQLRVESSTLPEP